MRNFFVFPKNRSEVLLRAFHGELELGRKKGCFRIGGPTWGFDESYPGGPTP